MGKVLSEVFQTENKYRFDNQGVNFGNNFRQAQEGFNQNLNNQNNLAQMLLAQANGQGVNPAEAMLRNATDSNIKSTASAIGSQKGINAGLAQRLIAQNAAEQQQKMAGQAAQLNAEQRLGALNQVGNVYGNIGSQNLQSQGLAQSGIMGANNINSGVAAQNTQVAGQLAGGVLSGVSSAFSKLGSAPPKTAAHGALIEGEPIVDGDSVANDVVPALLSPGEIVVPRSKAKDPEKAKEFISMLLKQNGQETESGSGYGEILALKKKIASLEKRMGKK